MKYLFFAVVLIISTACFSQVKNSGSQKSSPALKLEGQSSKTNSTPASQAVSWDIDSMPVQGKENPNAKDTVEQKKPEPVDSVYGFAIVLSKEEAAGLVKLIQSADEKPSIVKFWLDLLNARSQIVLNTKPETVDNKSKPKK